LQAAIDTTNILGRGAVKDTYNLLADGMVQVVRALAALAGEQVERCAARLGLARYVTGPSLKGQAGVAWEEPAEQRAFLAGLVADADRALDAVRAARGRVAAGSAADRALHDAGGLLGKLLLQDIERQDGGPAVREGVAKDRVVSVHDPDMRHGHKSKSKRFNGHKAQVVVDTDTQLVTAVAVLAGNAPDAEQALAVVQATEAATGCEVVATIGDCAYGDGQTRQAFVDAGRRLIAKVPAATNQERFPKTRFLLDLERGTCSCPAGQETTDLRPRGKDGKDGRVFRFAAAVCGACPLRSACVRGQGGRTVQVHPQEGLLQEARRFQASPAFAEYKRRRQTVEHRIARLVQLGIRHARYVGRPKTLFQLNMAAAVANLVRLSHMGERSTPVAMVTAMVAPFAPLFAMLTGIWDRWWPHWRPLPPKSRTMRTDVWALASEAATALDVMRPLRTATSRPGF
jgi:hypothetical protein